MILKPVLFHNDAADGVITFDVPERAYRRHQLIQRAGFVGHINKTRNGNRELWYQPAALPGTEVKRLVQILAPSDGPGLHDSLEMLIERTHKQVTSDVPW